MVLFWELNEMVLKHCRPEQEGIKKKKLMLVIWSDFRKGVLPRTFQRYRYKSDLYEML